MTANTSSQGVLVGQAVTSMAMSVSDYGYDRIASDCLGLPRIASEFDGPKLSNRSSAFCHKEDDVVSAASWVGM